MNREMKKITFLRTVGKTKSEIMQLWAYVTQCEKSNKYVTVKFPPMSISSFIIPSDVAVRQSITGSYSFEACDNILIRLSPDVLPLLPGLESD